LRLDPSQIRQDTRGHLIDLLQHHLLLGGLNLGRNEMLDALLGHQRDGGNQYDENHGVASLEGFHRRSRIKGIFIGLISRYRQGRGS